ncbi:MAG: di-heme oxidoredictase family protein [Acidobacteriota bacterium]
MQSLQIPLAEQAASPKHVSADYYYRMPVRPVYKSYPIYHPDKEPRGYLDSLKQQEPEIVFDASKLKTQADWIKAGKLVFDAPIEFESKGTLFSELRGRDWFEKNKVPLTREGVMPFMRYVVRERGKVEVGILACAHCHTRVMADGNTIKGAQGNFPDDRTFGYEMGIAATQAKEKSTVLEELRSFIRRSYASPWLKDDPNARPEKMSLDEIVAAFEAVSPGSCARQGTSVFYPAAIPDLIGVKDRYYLDSTGHVRHNSIGDLMRYAALNQGADMLSLYGTFRPVGELPDPSTQSRYSDEQLYALALYIYSLKPPPNPNKLDALATRGQKLFEREGCDICHTPPFYTSNDLTPADGFVVPKRAFVDYEILDTFVNTDSNLALKTRRGTGYYKIPSLRGVWYRGPFQHNGAVATLEDWFDPRRVKEGYVPTGFRGLRPGPVRGHEFGLSLSPNARKALIAFLKTL